MKVHVRYYAAVADAAGTREEEYDVATGTTVAQFREQMGAGKPAEFVRILGVCALIVDGGRAEESGVLGEDRTSGSISVEVLPPFAGG